MAEKCDCIVIGAGVVGLAVARALARNGREVLVLERQNAFGTETSSRNSEVIHAGIYYPTGSLKARMCVRGKELLYEYCENYRVPCERIGKIIVATSARQFETLRDYQRKAKENGAGELPWLSQRDVEKLEPAVLCRAAVLSPSTGIIDSHSFMLSLLGDLEAHNGIISYLTEVSAINTNSGITVRCDGFELAPQVLVNSTGLDAVALSPATGPEDRGYFAKGHYYVLSGMSPFNRLVYPVAEEGGLGVHVTLDLAHQTRFGPDVVWTDGPDYTFETSNLDRFIDAIRRYYPDLDATRLHTGYTGIRPKLGPADAPTSDFVINGPERTGVSGYVDLLGIESPGLTASLAIAERVVELIGR
ncbi:MAG: NAD(P)/FAD-dependent oxidoreductase [Pseudomonadota bacterium]|nr:FAD-dependent oxidoreductase [Gammaproteobacteria bacterium]MEC8868017.1 NAD(P)/FAD-dependent oxidoreductase [Pseudomonadota bacterium]HCP49173.1 FAD-dependent oxidoreductase [Gammaproteobacteria bacterium]